MAAQSLKDRLAQTAIVRAPGIYDALTAALAEKAGFEAVFVSGSAVAFSQLARPDIGLVSMTEMADVVARVRDRVDIHLFVDADSGFGNALSVARTVRAFERAGASGIQIEDQIDVKPDGQETTRPLVSADAMVGKIKAALDARHDGNTVISARSDAMFSTGLDDAMDRAARYAEAGADMVFVEGLKTAGERHRLCDLLSGKVPLLFNLMKPGADGMPTPDGLQGEGYSVVLFPGTAIGAASNAAWQALNLLNGNDIGTDSVAITDLIDQKEFLG
jgi:2-methylisocitrate lyase-like PEP mutase family enzyme